MGLATFLFGDATNITRFVSSSINAKESQTRIFSYAGDSWRVTPSLTLNLGVRWEIYFPETVNGPGAGGFADLTTGNVRLAGVGGFNSSMNAKTDYTSINLASGLSFTPQLRSVRHRYSKFPLHA